MGKNGKSLAKAAGSSQPPVAPPLDWGKWSFIGFVAITLLSGLGWVGDLYLTSKLEHIVSDKIKPMDDSIREMDKRLIRAEDKLNIQGVKALVNDLKAAPPAELQQKKQQIQQAKQDYVRAVDNGVAQSDFPTAAVLVRLASTSTFPVGELPMHRAIYNNSGGMNDHDAYIGLMGTVRNSTFINSIVTLDPGVHLVNVRFIHCIIILPEADLHPAPALQQIADSLLRAENLDSITVTG